MSITLDSLAMWIYRLRAIRMNDADRAKTKPNAGDDVTRVRDAYSDERDLLRRGQASTRLSAAHNQRDALRDQINIL